MPDRTQPAQKKESHVAIRKAPSRFLVMKTLEGELSSCRLRAEHLKGAQAGCCPRFDAELFEDMFFHRGFAIAKNRCDLAIGIFSMAGVSESIRSALKRALSLSALLLNESPFKFSVCHFGADFVIRCTCKQAPSSPTL